MSQTPESPLWIEVTNYLSHMRIERGSSQNTLDSYQRDLRRYIAYLDSRGITTVVQVDAGHIAEFLQAVRTGDDGGTALSERSTARVLASVRGAHKFWAMEGLTTHDPAAKISAPKQAETLPKALSVEEITRLLETPNSATAFGLRDRALLELLYASGARISEAISLDVDDIHAVTDATDSLVLLRVTGKGDKQRMVPLGSYAQRAVADYLTAGRPALAQHAKKSSPALFLNKLGGRLSRQSAWTVLQKTAADAGITVEVSPHTLRHSCATHLLEGGADIRTVQELLGHASVTTTQIYTKVTPQALQETYVSAHPRAL